MKAVEKTKSYVAGLLAAVAGVLPGVALAQEGGLRDAMRARMQARIEARQRGEPRQDRAQGDRAADNGAWQRRERAEPQQRGEWHRADRQARDDQRSDLGERSPDRPRGERGQRPDWRGDDRQTRPDRPTNTDQPRADRDGRPRAGRADRGSEDVRAENRRGRDRSGRNRPGRGWSDRDAASWRYQQARDERAWYDRSDFDERRDWNWRSDDARRWARGSGGWDRGWRQDRRYDWAGYRTGNRGAFHLPRYYAPYGWNGGYRRLGIGARLSSVLFAQRYWIDDPFAYRLPDPFGPYRWVRYYSDAVLVDVDSGEIVDVVHDLFW